MADGRSSTHYWIMAAILIVATAFRLIFTAYVLGFDAELRGDEIDYHEIGEHLSRGVGFQSFEDVPTGRRPPAFPFVLSILYRLVGPSVFAARILQLFLGVGIVLLTCLVGRRFFGATVGLVAAGFAALNPFLTFMTGYVLTENLFVVLTLCALLVIPTPGHAQSVRRTAVAAVLLAAAALARPVGVAIGWWIVLGTVLLSPGAWRARVGRGVVMAVVFVALLLPWGLRNYAVFGGWSGLVTNGGVTFYQGNNPKIRDIPHWRGGAAPVPALPGVTEMWSLNELERDRYCWEMGKAFVRDNWRNMPGIVVWKFVRFWRLESDMGLSGIRSGWWFGTNQPLSRAAADLDLGFVYAVVALPLFVAGLIITRRRARELFFVYGVIAAHAAVGVVFFGSLRGRVPIEPLIGMFAAVALVAVARRFRPKAGAG